MTQPAAIAAAAFFLGIGLAGEPFNPLRGLLAAILLAATALRLGAGAGAFPNFLTGFLGVLVTCVLQHGTAYPGTGVVAFGLGALGAASLGRRTAPALIASLGTAIGCGLFFIGVPAGY